MTSNLYIYLFFIFCWNKIKTHKEYHTAKQFQNTITHPYKEENSIQSPIRGKLDTRNASDDG